MKIMNPTPFLISGMACGRPYVFQPGEEKDVYNEDHAKILVKHNVDLGLVHLVFNEAMEKKYETYEAFKEAQRLNGLKAILAFKKQAWINERQAEIDIKHNKGAEADKAIVHPERFEKEIALVEKAIEDLRKDDKLRGSMRANVEPARTQNKNAA